MYIQYFFIAQMFELLSNTYIVTLKQGNKRIHRGLHIFVPNLTIHRDMGWLILFNKAENKQQQK